MKVRILVSRKIFNINILILNYQNDLNNEDNLKNEKNKLFKTHIFLNKDILETLMNRYHLTYFII